MADVKYTYTFTNEGGIKFKVDFIQFGYSGAATTLIPTSLGFSKEYKGMQNEIYQPFIASEVTVELHNGVNERAFVQELADADAPNLWFCIIRRWGGSSYTVDWRGVVNIDGITLPDASTFPEVGTLTVKADDGFGQLDNLRFTPTGGMLSSTLSVYYFLYEAIKVMTRDVLIAVDEPFIAMCQHWYEQSMTQATTTDPMARVYFNAQAFVQANDYGETVGMTWREIWENILSTWNLSVVQDAGLYYFVNFKRYLAGSTYSKKYIHFKRAVDDPDDYIVGTMITSAVTLPTSRGAGGQYSNLSQSGRVNASYQYKSSIYGDSLLPDTLQPSPITVLDNSFTHTVYSMCVSEEGKPMHIQGSFAATIRDTGTHAQSFKIFIELKIKCGTNYLHSFIQSPNEYYWDGAYILGAVSFSEEIYSINIPVTTKVVQFNFDTPPLPTTGDEVTLEINQVQIFDEDGNPWTETNGGHTFSFECVSNNDWNATIGLANEMAGTAGFKAYTTGDFEYDLPETCIGDATHNFHVSKIKILNASDVVVNSEKWDTLLIADYDYNVHEFRAREIKAWVSRNISMFQTTIYGELEFVKKFQSTVAYYAIISATYYANDNRYEATLCQLAENYTDITVEPIGTSNGNSSSGGGPYVGSGVNSQLWRRTGSILTPVTGGDNVNTSGIIGNQQSVDNYAVFPAGGQVELSSDDNSIKEVAKMVGSIADDDTLFEKYLTNGTNEVYKQIVKAAGAHDVANSGCTYELSTAKENDTSVTERIKVDKDGRVILNTNCIIEEDGTMKFDPDATVFNDINTGVNPRNTGAGRPTLASFVGNLQEFQFAVNDFADLTPIELLHGWKEGSEIEFHLHWATGGSNDATARGVKWEIEYTIANKDSAFPATTVISAEATIASGEAANTHHYTSIGNYTFTGGLIGAQISFRVKRITASGTAPATNPFLLSIGIHYEIDTIGSRTKIGK